MREPLMEIARLHPEYGYRRTTSELVDQGFAVNHKVVQRLHRHWHLSVLRKVRPSKPNPIGELLKAAGSKINLVAHLKEIDDLEVLYTDFTEIVYHRGHLLEGDCQEYRLSYCSLPFFLFSLQYTRGNVGVSFTPVVFDL